MKKQITAAPPPIFSDFVAATIKAAAFDYPDADGLLVDIPSQRTLIAASTGNGVIDRWVIESTANDLEVFIRQAQLKECGLNYISLTMHTDKIAPLGPTIKH